MKFHIATDLPVTISDELAQLLLNLAGDIEPNPDLLQMSACEYKITLH